MTSRWTKLRAGLVLLLAAGCSTPLLPPLPPATPPHQAASRGLTDEQVKDLESVRGDYHLGAGDVIQLYTLDATELNRRYAIGPDGKITVPGIGVVPLDGLTRDQSAASITGLLAHHYLNPKVDVIIEEYNNNRVSVLGEVRWPGQYNFPNRPTLLDALARAQGLTSRADMHGCVVVRGQGMVIEIDLYDLLRKGDRTLNIPLLPEDSVFVRADEEHTFYVLGEVNRPGVFQCGQEMDVVRAISQAGGFTENGALGRVHIIRRGKDRTAMLDVDMDAILRGQMVSGPSIEANDIIYVQPSGIAKFNYYLRQFTPALNTWMLGQDLKNTGK